MAEHGTYQDPPKFVWQDQSVQAADDKSSQHRCMGLS